MQKLSALLLIIMVWVENCTDAAELRLRQQCCPRGSVITLGDVAEIYTVDKQQCEKLSSIELLPAPLAPQQRVLRIREIQDLLIMRGINLADHRFSGSNQVIVGSTNDTLSDHDQCLSVSAVKRSQRRVQEAILQYLKTKTALKHEPILQFEPNTALTRAAGNPSQPISISGGSPPWTGMQHFEVAADTPQGPVRFALDVQVTAPSAMVAAVHPLARDAVIQQSDVTLVYQSPGEGENSGFHAIEEVVGKQTTRAIGEGKILGLDDLQSPLMVHRGDVVTVYATSAGIRARTTARAREDGGLGTLVTVETMQDRKTYQARVCGIREADVIAQAVPAAERK